MEFKEIQKMVEEPYKRLGFYDQWNMTQLKEIIDYIIEKYKLLDVDKYNLTEPVKNLEVLMSVAEISLFSEEIGELLDSIRKGMPLIYPFKKKGETTIGEECADLFIRLVNFCNRKGIDLESEIIKKHKYNEQRQYLHGKRA